MDYPTPPDFSLSNIEVLASKDKFPPEISFPIWEELARSDKPPSDASLSRVSLVVSLSPFPKKSCFSYI